MVDLDGSIALVTGASSGIGTACARSFARAGARLVLLARSGDRLRELQAELADDSGGACYVLPCDVRDRAAVTAAVASLPPSWSDIDVLVNNAGLSRGFDRFPDCSIEDWEEMIDTNLKGLLYVTRALVPGMVARDRGHIINIGSIAGHQTYPRGNVYCATKAAVRALSEGLKLDLLGTAVRVSSVDPGLVETNFSNVRFHGDRVQAAKTYAGMTPLTPEDIAEVVAFCASRPPHVNISEVLVIPTDQSSSTLVHRRLPDERA
ncbi:short-chain alcohol dehydrogenase of unknown specificity [Rubidibacter lacunae KORDI 51-2]|uniref:Short-chain dehydrogenase n=2 Tax=Rubidibacter TaxID=582491 RepID=U5DTX1_9CHRO|nr:short-chain alcohol dehydrogenase of unknown specificity [Rubidibacter lacunae KORDI 51-2]